MTVPIPEADFPPPRSSKRKDREESEAAEAEEDDDARRRMRGKTLVITDEMRSAGVNDVRHSCGPPSVLMLTAKICSRPASVVVTRVVAVYGGPTRLA